MKRIYKGRVFEVYKKKVCLPRRCITEVEMVTHPGAALIVPFLSKDKVIMLRQFRPVIGKYLFELPAGTLNKGESPVSCAQREVVEESGYAAKKISRLGEIYPVPGYSTEKIVIFRADGLKPASAEMDKDEVIERKILTKNQVRMLFKRGKIVDAKTICALSMCGWLG